jgi:hypothetical protein
VRRLLSISLALLMTGILIFASACGNSGTTATVTSSSPAVKLAFITQPKESKAGVSFNPQLVVAAQDAAGNTVTDYKGTVKIAITQGTGDKDARLMGGVGTALNNGRVEFKNLSIDKVGTYTLTASIGNLEPAVSAPLTILPGEAAALAFSVQPTGGIAGKPLTTSPEVIAKDIYGNTVTDYTGSVTMLATMTFPNYYSSPENGQPKFQIVTTNMEGTSTVPFINGVARFTDLSRKMSMDYYNLKATSGSLTSVTSQMFSIEASDPAKIVFTVQPVKETAGESFYDQPVVAVEDQFNNVCNSAKLDITVSITPGTGTPGAVLSGTTTLISTGGFGGLAQYSYLSIDLVGSGYTLTAVASNNMTATTDKFDIVEPEPTPTPTATP